MRRCLPWACFAYLLMSGGASANAGIPLFLPNILLSFLAFIPVVILEGVILQKKLILSYRNAFFSSVLANAFSTIIGISFYFLASLLFMIGDRFLLAGMLILLVPAFFLSWIIEYSIVRGWLIKAKDVTRGRARPSNAQINNACFQANIVSHIFMALLIVGLRPEVAHALRAGPANLDSAISGFSA